MVYQELGCHTYDWAGMTAQEISDLADADGSVLVIPIASI